MKQTIGEIIDKLLEYDPKYRDSDNELYWRVLEVTGHIKDGVLSKDDFLHAPSYKTVTRHRRNYQRSDRILGNNMVQASTNTRERRRKLAKEKGQSFISAQSTQPKYIFNNDTMTYEEQKPI